MSGTEEELQATDQLIDTTETSDIAGAANPDEPVDSDE